MNRYIISTVQAWPFYKIKISYHYFSKLSHFQIRSLNLSSLGNFLIRNWSSDEKLNVSFHVYELRFGKLIWKRKIIKFINIYVKQKIMFYKFSLNCWKHFVRSYCLICTSKSVSLDHRTSSNLLQHFESNIILISITYSVLSYEK